jgi:chromatin segregation and condensation protein Rec8/ScpA/Scc1 (kleisin family)
MDDASIQKIQKAAKLLAKAESTDSTREAAALLEMSDSFIRQVIVAIERAEFEEDGSARPPERRFMFDRRKSRVLDTGSPGVGTSEDPSVALSRYRRFSDENPYETNKVNKSV